MAITDVLSLFSVSDIDNNIVCKDLSSASAFNYVNTIVDHNRERIARLCGVNTLFTDRDTNSVHIRGPTVGAVQRAMIQIKKMLQGPVFTCAVPVDEVVALRVLKGAKKDFSALTGCWMHFQWVTRTVFCYGIDGSAAEEYIQNVCALVRKCRDTDGNCNGYTVAQRDFPRRWKNLIKKFVDYVEQQSGARVAVKSDNKLSGVITCQFYGRPDKIDIACKVIQDEILTRSPAEGMIGPFPATPLAPNEVPRCSGNERQTNKQPIPSEVWSHQAQAPPAVQQHAPYVPPPPPLENWMGMMPPMVFPPGYPPMPPQGYPMHPPPFPMPPHMPPPGYPPQPHSLPGSRPQTPPNPSPPATPTLAPLPPPIMPPGIMGVPSPTNSNRSATSPPSSVGGSFSNGSSPTSSPPPSPTNRGQRKGDSPRSVHNPYQQSPVDTGNASQIVSIVQQQGLPVEKFLQVLQTMAALNVDVHSYAQWLNSNATPIMTAA